MAINKRPAGPGKATRKSSAVSAAASAARRAETGEYVSGTPARVRKAAPAKPYSVRMDASTAELIDRAAQAVGQTRTEFLLFSARRRATDVLLDQTLIRLNKADWNAFQRALDEPVAANDDLRALMTRKAPWEK